MGETSTMYMWSSFARVPRGEARVPRYRTSM